MKQMKFCLMVLKKNIYNIIQYVFQMPAQICIYGATMPLEVLDLTDNFRSTKSCCSERKFLLMELLIFY